MYILNIPGELIWMLEFSSWSIYWRGLIKHKAQVVYGRRHTYLLFYILRKHRVRWLVPVPLGNYIIQTIGGFSAKNSGVIIQWHKLHLHWLQMTKNISRYLDNACGSHQYGSAFEFCCQTRIWIQFGASNTCGSSVDGYYSHLAQSRLGPWCQRPHIKYRRKIT